MPFIALTGPTGVGKSYIQKLLREQLHIPTITTITTRAVKTDEHSTATIQESDLVDRVRRGELVAPLYFGGHYYTWSASAIQENRSFHWLSVNVRPYTALMIASLVAGSIAIYLDATPQILEKRRQLRAVDRDVGMVGRVRHHSDKEDAERYQKFFSNVLVSDDDVVNRIADLISKAG